MFKKILIPIDGSPLAKQAAQAGIDFAKSIDASVVIVNVLPPFSETFAYDSLASGYSFTIDDVNKAMQEEAEKGVKPIIDHAIASGVKVDSHSGVVSHHNVAEGIVETADALDCDLIFIGSHGRSGISRLLLGSVTAKVLPLATTAVLVHRAEEE